MDIGDGDGKLGSDWYGRLLILNLIGGPTLEDPWFDSLNEPVQCLDRYATVPTSFADDGQVFQPDVIDILDGPVHDELLYLASLPAEVIVSSR